MFESHAVQNQAVQNQAVQNQAVQNQAVQTHAVESQPCLYEGAYVRLDIRWHHNPVFVCEKAGDHFRVAGFEYGGDGRPLKAHVPTPGITGILPDHK